MNMVGHGERAESANFALKEAGRSSAARSHDVNRTAGGSSAVGNTKGQSPHSRNVSWKVVLPLCMTETFLSRAFLLALFFFFQAKKAQKKQPLSVEEGRSAICAKSEI